MNYSELTRRYFESAAHAGELHGPGVFRGAAGALSEGTWVQFDIEMTQGRARAVRFRAFGCPHTIAVAAWLAEVTQEKPLLSVLPESVPQLRARFDVPVEKMGRLLVIEDAWLAAAMPAIEKPR